MFGDNKNLKDSENVQGEALHITIKDTTLTISYTKTNKLITALYMVTDIISEGEPLRNKLRTLGVEIISDIHQIERNNIGHIASIIHSKIAQILSFLELAFTINIISEMNCRILKKEFLELDQSIKESTGKAGVSDRKINLVEFFKEDSTSEQSTTKDKSNSIGHSIGHQHYTRIGVQKGSTLMKAIKDMSDRVPSLSGVGHPTRVDNFDILKKQRREDITNIIKIVGGSATIKDIKDKVQTAIGQATSLVSCGEKTLQRELVSMVKDGVLNKTGEKRWSRYFLKN